MKDYKRVMERKLTNAIVDFQIDCGKRSLSEIYLSLGIICGIDMALREYCIHFEPTNASYRNSHYMKELDSYSFRKMKLKEIHNHAFPSVVYEYEIEQKGNLCQ